MQVNKNLDSLNVEEMEKLEVTIGSTLDAADLAYMVENWYNDINYVQTDFPKLDEYIALVISQSKEITSDLTYITSYRDEATGLTIAVFEDKNGDIIVAPAGTNLSGWEEGLKDVIADASLIIGNQQTQAAMLFMAALLTSYSDKNIILTGHSLGGGIAGDLALFWGLPVIAYNGAPISNIYSLLSNFVDVKSEYAVNFIN